jgi:divalent metal cation (Fe/Co/Zn/Cd) transporter
VANTALSLGKLVIGIITGYIAIVSKAVHALIGLVAALIAYILLSGKPLQHWKKAENMCLNF